MAAILATTLRPTSNEGRAPAAAARRNFVGPVGELLAPWCGAKHSAAHILFRSPESAYSRDANDLYENGILLVKTAGNTGHSSASDCTIGSPGSAIGVFTVGGHGNSYYGTETNVRSGEVLSYTSRGGTSLSEGKNRSIVDVTAYACRMNLFDMSLGYSAPACGTSISAPTVTAGAINFIDYYKDSHSNLIGEPGMLYTHLLLMGDRQGESGKITHGYDHLWGAGRLKMRRLDAAGMDSPYGWQAAGSAARP
ncbi:S8 family serine peptidase [Sorangium sp. So ce1151]|uniref:S8 family serine peptidase n=1 Tax=Sorangium sp. So ce1151 TaxID=3133332 RepID=UPI003F5D60BC